MVAPIRPHLNSPSSQTKTLHRQSQLSNQAQNQSKHFTLSQKAEKILGLQPGTLAHAKAALENARDEVRRTASPPSPSSSAAFPFVASSTMYGGNGNGTGREDGGGGMRGKMARAKDKVVTAVSSGLPQAQSLGQNSHYRGGSMGGGGGGGVHLGIGGIAEEEMRERRRKATDGVLFWQREVERLEDETKAVQTQAQIRDRGQVGTGNGRRR